MYHIIINPASRSGKGLKIWKEQIEPALHKEKITYRSYFSNAAGDIARIVKEVLATDSTRPLSLIVLGGDGTINEALQGMANPKDIILGYIPTGSSNDFARDLNLPTKPLEALSLILHTGHAVPMDLGCITFPDGAKRSFAVSCGIGFDAAVCENSQHSKIKIVLNKLGLGKLTYLGIALKQLFTAKNTFCTLSLDNGGAITIPRFLFVTGMVHRYEGGGFMFCPAADAHDGILNLCAVGNISKPMILLALPTAFWGKHYFAKGITPHQAASFSVQSSEPLWVHTDGEVIRKCNGFTASCLKDAIQFMVK